MEALREKVGQHLGYSDWLHVSRDRVRRFAEVTGDRQWIHLDGQRAASGRFGAPVAHGYLILALISPLLPQILPPTKGIRVNVGCDKVRFFAPVPVGAHIRLGATLISVQRAPGGSQAALAVVFTVRERQLPVCAARVLLRCFDDPT
jgi:acyl dehydratase